MNKQWQKNPPSEYDDWAANDYWKAKTLSNYIYAGMIVKLWADMEEFLNTVIKNHAKITNINKPESSYKFAENIYNVDYTKINLKELCHNCYMFCSTLLNKLEPISNKNE